MVLDWQEYKQKAVEAITEGNVLLENRENALPLDINKTIAIFGRIQLNYYKSGTGSGGLVNVSRVVGIPEGLKQRGASLDEELLEIYKKWVEKNPFELGEGWGGEPRCQKEMPLDEELVKQVAGRCETALVIIGRTAGEEMDNFDERGSYRLTEDEENMLLLTRRHFRKCIVVLNVPAIMDMSFVDIYQPDAVLYAWHGGMMGGLGTADILLGKVNPSGKLSDTIAYRLEDYPSHPYFGNTKRECYCEDIYVGYRYFETFVKEKVRYPFGFGLSYTEFSYSDIQWEAGGTERILVMVTNCGAVAGKEAVQVYCEAPQGMLGKPAKVLCGFRKTRCLKPGESETLSIDIARESIASFDDSGVTGHRFAFVLEAGDYAFHVGKSVRDIQGTLHFCLDELEVVEEVITALAPVTAFERMRNEQGKLGFEPVPLSTIDEQKRRMEDMPEEIAYTGDLGIRLADVVNGKHTLDEFIGQLSDEDLSCIIRGEGMGSPKVTAGTAAAFGGVSDHLSQLGVPCVCCADGPSGMRLDCGTKAFSLPGGVMLACTWNTQLMTELFSRTGLEMRANHVECLLGPGLNIHRHPLNGRNFEYFSEDPFLTGEIAAAQLKGLHSAGVTGTIKHFCGNNQETGRHTMDSVISERALREIYLRGFETAVKKGKAYTIMTTYGSVNGVWTAGSYDLNTTILRKEWGFKGLSMSDWWANISRRGQEPDKRDFAAMAMAQNDVYMVCPDGQKHDDNTLESLASGELQRAELQRNAANILEVVIRSQAMQRLLGTAEEVEIAGKDDEVEEVQKEVPCFRVGKEITVDLSTVEAKRGTSYSFILDFEKLGDYEFILTAASDAGELAQIPVTVFSMGTARGTYTWNGTGGKPVSFSGRTEIFSRYTTIRLYFAQNGLKLSEMAFRLIAEK